MIAAICAVVVGMAICLVVLHKPSNQKTTKLYVYTWADYIDPDIVAEFEKRHSCEVVIDTFDSNESMYAKLKAGAIGYDIITPTEYIMPLLLGDNHNNNLLESMDMSRLPNVERNIDRDLTSKWSCEWNVPYCFSCTGILWRKDKIPEGLKFLDWRDLFDPRLKKSVCIMDDIRELLGIALKVNGHSVNSRSKDEIDKAGALAKEWRNRSRKMDNEAYRTGVPAGEFAAAMAYNSDAIMILAAEGGENFGYTIPTNGTISSMDVMCVMKTSRNKDLAFKFIDNLYDKTNAVRNSEYNCAPMPVKGLFESLPDKYKSLPLMKIDKAFKAQCEDIEDVGEDLEKYSSAWDKVKSEN